MDHRHHVVIVGGGFGGLYAAKALARAPVRVTLIDRRNFHLFQPLLYQVATGGLSPGEIAAPLRAILRRQKNASVLLGEVTDLDPTGRRVLLADGEASYDSLVLAPGAGSHYFGNAQWEKFAPALKTIEDATEIRRRILLAFEAAEREPDAERRRSWLTFVVVGGGPTGVELAGALGEIAHDTLRDDFRSIHPEESRILLIDAASRVLPPYPPDLAAKAERALIRLGVRCRNHVKVTSIDAEGVTIEGPAGVEHIATHTVLWAAGVAASPLGRILAARTGMELDRAGRVPAGPDLSVPGRPEIFVIGDLARVNDADGNALPGVAPVAMEQGRYVARLIAARVRGETTLPRYRHFNKGNLATIGRRAAVADFGWLRLSGTLAWLAWLFIHLMYLVQFQSRVIVFIRWAFQYVTFNRGARLITGAAPAALRPASVERSAGPPSSVP